MKVQANRIIAVCGLLVAAAIVPSMAMVEEGPWYFLGPFKHEGDFWQEQTHGPEQDLDLGATYQGKYGQMKWRDAPEWRHNRVMRVPANLDSGFGVIRTAISVIANTRVGAQRCRT